MLPISKYKEEIIAAVLKHRNVIISSRPGTGKSTLLPEYLSSYFDKVIVTNPRVIVAITLAMYVARNMRVTLGEKVGYRTGYNKCASKDTVIEYCTDAFHMIKSIWNENGQKKIALVIDEVHEWTEATEVLVAWCKFMANKWNTKIVIMSATIEQDKIAKFLGEDTYVFDIPGKVHNIKAEQRPEGLIKYTIKEMVRRGKNIQVFLATKKEIYEIMEDLDYLVHDQYAVILPLHGDLSFEEQQKCFAKYNRPLVVLSTNIGQTGLTIPGINCVIDSGEAMVPIERNGVIELRRIQISKADITQRMWRSARSEDGEYYLCSNTPIAERDEYPVPEIQRSLLDQVVLRLAANGINIEDLEFYHQPSLSAIKEAKKKLKIVGAVDDNGNVTEKGQKIARMPISVEKACQILEAEKYGVVEPVITISAIMEMGGLLARKRGNNTSAGRYSNFTEETRSDLLAELDVWNYLNSLEWIDFEGLCINGKNYFRIKNHIKKMHEALNGIVEFSNGNDRTLILKACLSAYASNENIFVETYGTDIYLDANENERQLNYSSCLRNGYGRKTLIVGTPLTLPKTSGDTLELITFATVIDEETLKEFLPNAIEVVEEVAYVPSIDQVSIRYIHKFRGCFLTAETYYDDNHPQLAELRTKYEEEQREEAKTRYQTNECVLIDGMPLNVHQEWNGREIVKYVDIASEEELFTKIKSNEAFLASGTQVRFRIYSSTFRRYQAWTIRELKNMLEVKRLADLRISERERLSRTEIKTIYDAVDVKDILGKFVLTMDNGGYGENEIYSYRCLTRKGNVVKCGIVSDEEEATTLTNQGLQYLFMEEVKQKYRESRFSHIPGKKKKVLTDSEKEAKENFDSLVRDVLRELDFDNALENLEFLEEYYNELMK